MDIGKLGKAARKELTRNPKKAAILGLLCLVALYFWGPLVWSWLPVEKSAAEPEPKVVAQGGQSQQPTAQVTPDKPSVKPEQKFHWNEIIRWMENDVRMATVELATDSRDPFQTISKTQQEIAAKQSEDNPEQANNNLQRKEYKPSDVGLALEGVIIGPRYSAATISGKIFRLGSQVTAAANKSQGESATSHRIEFVLQEIHSRHVVLQRAGKSYSLKIKGTKLAGGERLEFSKSPSSDQ